FLVWPNAAAYAAARHAVAGFSEALRSEVKVSGLSVTLVVLGLVETPYWQHNPGSREHAPKTNPLIAPVLRPEQAAEAICTGIEARKRMVVKPRIFRALFLLNALAPRLVGSQIRRAVPRHD